MKVAVVFITCIAFTHAYPTGPPLEACGEMFPTGHGVSAMTTPAPFEVIVSGTCFKSGATLRVSVKSAKTKKAGGTEFEGMFVQARQHTPTSVGTEAVGTFTTTDKDLKTQDCFSRSKSAISHAKDGDYYCKEFTWTAPADLTRDIVFTSTIVHEKEEFWTEVRSATVTFNANCNSTAPPASMCDASTSGTREMAASLGVSILTLVSIMMLLVASRA